MPGKLLIIGAGLTGLSTAFHLEKMGGIDYSVYEKREKVGGLCRSEYVRGRGFKGEFTFDILGHLLHLKEEYTKGLVERLLEGNLRTHFRNSWIYSKGVYTNYPFQANTHGLPPEVVKDCVLGFIDAKSRPFRSEKDLSKVSFNNWILRNFGKGIAKHFMIPYNQKIWTVHPRDLTCGWIKVNPKYVPSPNIREVVIGALGKQRKGFGYNVYFRYPRRGGIQKLPDAFKAKIKNLKLDTDLSKVDIRKKIAYFKRGKFEENFKFLVSTIPLPELILNIISNVPEEIKNAARKLKHTSVLNFNMGIKRKNIDRGDWVYFPEKKYVFYRIGFPKKFSEEMCPAGTSSIYVEIACKPGKMTQERKEELFARAKKDLIKAEILETEDEILLCKPIQIPYAYVIYDQNRDRNLEIIQDYLKEKDIYSVGRYGSWKYSTMEEAILEGKKVAEELASEL
ncbi:MAG: NAD(P)/FAD-dependent oxidoreductase [bacterium]